MIPVKPFDTYKWRWLSVQPSEGLLQAPVFLGVLRVLSRFEGQAFSSVALRDALGVVKAETIPDSKLQLAREPSRNLFRNSGQYWKGTGLLASQQGEIHLTSFGKRVASGQITQAEFAAIMVQQTILPNPWTYSPQELAKWRAANLEIRPLKLILELIENLGRNFGNDAAFLTSNELINVVIPLAGEKLSPENIAPYVFRFRAGQLDTSSWPDYAPEANDKRLAREFLLFLSNFGFLRLEADGLSNSEQRFHMDELFAVDEEIAPQQGSIFGDAATADQTIENIIHSPLPSIVERQRMVTTVLARRGQAQFRSRILKAYSGRCWLTNEAIPEVLEAAHIVPVNQGGSDAENNGICLRVDVHRLYDSGNIRIRPSGDITFSEVTAASANYSSLPRKMIFPPFINPANIAWRDEYS